MGRLSRARRRRVAASDYLRLQGFQQRKDLAFRNWLDINDPEDTTGWTSWAAGE